MEAVSVVIKMEKEEETEVCSKHVLWRDYKAGKEREIKLHENLYILKCEIFGRSDFHDF
jgi:hypothetical protein